MKQNGSYPCMSCAQCSSMNKSYVICPTNVPPFLICLTALPLLHLPHCCTLLLICSTAVLPFLLPHHCTDFLFCPTTVLTFSSAPLLYHYAYLLHCCIPFSSAPPLNFLSHLLHRCTPLLICHTAVPLCLSAPLMYSLLFCPIAVPPLPSALPLYHTSHLPHCSASFLFFFSISVPPFSSVPLLYSLLIYPHLICSTAVPSVYLPHHCTPLLICTLYCTSCSSAYIAVLRFLSVPDTASPVHLFWALHLLVACISYYTPRSSVSSFLDTVLSAPLSLQHFLAGVYMAVRSGGKSWMSGAIMWLHAH